MREWEAPVGVRPYPWTPAPLDAWTPGRLDASSRGLPGDYRGGWSFLKYVQLVSFGSPHASGAWANSG